MNTNTDMPKLEYHHTALVVKNMQQAIGDYAVLFGKDKISAIYAVTTQKVNVCFVETGINTYLELVEPATPDAPVISLLKKQHTYYHIGYKVKDIYKTVACLEEQNYKAMAYYNSEAFGGKTCIFLFTPLGHLIELIEED